MKATNKSPEIRDLMNYFLDSNITREEAISEALCVMCDATDVGYHSFRDTLSVDEYQISGMCQECQDSIWNCVEEDMVD